jgi:mannitol-1-phosphate 5-dehydrogenase
MKGGRVFVGIGAGAIQLGLWAYYAFRRGAKVVLAEVDAPKGAAIRRNHGRYAVNIAGKSGIRPVRVGPVRVLNPAVAADRNLLVAALKEAGDVVTAVPSTRLYDAGVADLLREGLGRRHGHTVVYASENEIGAAQLLESRVFPVGGPRNVRFVDTVIERMGGPQGDRALRRRLKLVDVAPGMGHALLVEEFDEIVVGDAGKGHSRLFGRFLRTDNIRLYEERKLYGHNAVHFLLGALGARRGYREMGEWAGDPDLVRLGYGALREETGAWFTARYGRMGEEAATREGFRAWADRLMERITAPHLHDAVARIIRDPERKLGWDDRIIGTMRRALAAGVEPWRHARGVAAALRLVVPKRRFTPRAALARLESLWERGRPAAERRRVLACVGRALSGRGDG